MRFYQKIETILSEDEISVPKIVQFQEARELAEIGDATPIKDGGGRTETIPTGTTDYAIALGNITTGKWFYFYSDQDFDLKINGGTALRILAGRPCTMHLDYTQLEVSTTNASDLRLTWAVGGD